MQSWKRDGDHALDEALRAARPEPRAEFAQAIADQLPAPESGGRKRRAGRLRLALAGSIAALAITPVVALGFGFGGFGGLKSSSVQNVFKAQDRSASIAQYQDDNEVLVCFANTSEIETTPELAAFYVNFLGATYGPCPD
jgi:hypothetical protein